jgi:hypothetical protein
MALTRIATMSAIEWTYRWERHEVRVDIRRDSHCWDRLYLDGALVAEQRGWHFFPIILTAEVREAGAEKHQVDVRVGWGLRCRIWIDSMLSCYAVSKHWFLLQAAGHSIEMGYREWYLWRRVRLSIDGQLIAVTVGKGVPSKLGIVAEGKFKRAEDAVAQVVARAGSVNGTTLDVDSALIFRAW